MKRRRHTPEQIIRKLLEGERLLAEGQELAQVAKHLEVAESTWHRWMAQVRRDDGRRCKRLRELERENQRLKRIVADQALDIDMLKDPSRGNLTPERRRRAVVRLTRGFGVSERRACRVVGQHRSTQRAPEPAPVPAEERLRAMLRTFSREHPRWGFRRAWRVRTREGLRVNRKRVQRLWREEGLRVPQRARKRRRRGTTTGTRARLLQAAAVGDVWAIDFQFDETACGWPLKLLNIVDEFSREARAITVARRIDSDRLVEVLVGLARSHGTPTHVRMDNGPELTAHALRDWAPLPPATSNPEALGRTPTSRVSTVACAMSCSLRSSSTRCWRPRCSSRPSESSTARSGRIECLVGSPPPGSAQRTELGE